MKEFFIRTFAVLALIFSVAKGIDECFETHSSHVDEDGIEYLSDMDKLVSWDYKYQFNYLRFVVMCPDVNDANLFGGIIA